MGSVHPFAVHFPIALLAAAAILELAALVARRPELSRAGWWNQLLGTIGIAVAVATGLMAEREVRVPTAAETLGLHEQLAFAATALFALLLLWRIAGRTEIPRHPRHLFLALLVVGVGFLFAVSWFGGELVYRHGVGVQ